MVMGWKVSVSFGLTGLQDFLDSVIQDSLVNNAHDNGSGHTTPTAEPRVQRPSRSQSPDRASFAQLSSSNLARTTVHDVSVDVVIAPLIHAPDGSLHTPERKNAYSKAIQAACIISVWNIEDTQYFTLTFTSATATEPAQSMRPTSRVVNRTNTIPTLDNKSRSSGSSSSSGRRSGGNSNSNSKAATPTLQQPEFPPRGPPLKSKGDISSTASIFQKATQLKDAILNSINMPAYGKPIRNWFLGPERLTCR
jgi:hypothetical protein